MRGARGKRYPLRSRIFRALCTQPEPHEIPADYYATTWYDEHLAADRRFFDRLPPALSFEGKSVLDYGCGAGHTCLLAAQRGARRVLGVDIGDVDFARDQLVARDPELAERVEFRQIANAGDVDGERFDIVLSKNSFEHVDDPAAYVEDMKSLLAPGGEIVIGFGALWKSPYGGHIDFMTKLPWAHLLFPEELILRERKRFRPDEDPSCFEEIKGGLNRMTVGKFETILAGSGLQPIYLELNRNDRKVAKALNVFSRVPGLREYFTFSVHSVWQQT